MVDVLIEEGMSLHLTLPFPRRLRRKEIPGEVSLLITGHEEASAGQLLVFAASLEAWHRKCRARLSQIIRISISGHPARALTSAFANKFRRIRSEKTPSDPRPHVL